MPRKIAIDWDTDELRVVVGRTTASGVVINDIVVQPITETGPSAFVDQLRSVLERLNAAKLPILLTLGRGKSELRQLQLPPVPPEEVPGMVRFQAIRDFAAAGERAIVDYIVTSQSDRGLSILASATSPESLAVIEKTLGNASEVDRIALRPLAAAALFAKHHPGFGSVVLVDLLSSDVDLVILRSGKPVFVRSVRLPQEQEAKRKALVGEVRRSIMASRSTEPSGTADPGGGGGEKSGGIERIVIWGTRPTHSDDIQHLSERIGLTVETLDPLSLVDVAPEIVKGAPAHVGRLAPLIGLLDVDEGGSDLLIDFLNPRKPPDPKSYRDRILLYGGAVAALALLIVYSIWSSLSTRDGEIVRLQKQLAELQPLVQASQQEIDRAEMVETFLDGNVIWIDQLRRIAEKMPPAEELVLTGLDANMPQRLGGELSLTGRVTEPNVVEKLRLSLQDEMHRVTRQGASEAPGDSKYSWDFRDMKIILEPSRVRMMRQERLQSQALASEHSDAGSADVVVAGAETEQPIKSPRDSADSEIVSMESEGFVLPTDAGDQTTDPAEGEQESPQIEADPAGEATTAEEPMDSDAQPQPPDNSDGQQGPTEDTAAEDTTADLQTTEALQ